MLAGRCQSGGMWGYWVSITVYRTYHQPIQFVGASEFQLVETLAERTAEIIIKEFGVSWLRLRVNKQGALRGARDVGDLKRRMGRMVRPTVVTGSESGVNPRRKQDAS